jgi:O-antigen/teichoic acid export membrane protein
MKKKFIQDISFNSLQVIINQLCGLVIFYILSVNLIKNDFGEINWSLAVLLTIFNMLSLGIDQVIVKKIATRDNVAVVFPAYAMHVFFSGFLLYTLLFIGYLFFRDFFQTNQILLALGIGKLMIYFSTAFKQLATGLERFKSLFYMSVCSNILRSIALVIFASLHLLNIKIIIIIFIAGDLAELLLCLLITKYQLKYPIKYKWNKKNYIDLVKESLPQLGISICSTAIARMDWILLGLLSTNIILANYSFAYKVFEAASLPLVIIAPVLITRISKIFHNGAKITNIQKNRLLILLRFEIIVACLVALILNILWIPVIDFITDNKYGAVNKYIILILSTCMPVLYFNNFLWTISLALGNLKKIFYISLICFIINLITTIILIPFFNGEGAAAAYLFTLFIQAILFFRHSGFSELEKNIFSFILPLIYAIAGGILANWWFSNTWLILVTAVTIYFACLFLTKQIRRNDWQLVIQQSDSKQAT